jgi:uncharacterized repeat protein (TIGR01451 family)
VFVRSGELRLDDVLFSGNLATGGLSTGDFSDGNDGQGFGGALFLCSFGNGEGQIDHVSAGACNATVHADSTLACFTDNQAADGQPDVFGPWNSDFEVGCLELSVFKELTDGHTASQAGEILSYRVTATNIGQLPLTSVSISDPLLDDEPESCGTLEKDQSCELTGNYTLTQQDIDDGQVSNAATANSDQTDPAHDTLVTNIAQHPSLSLVKTAQPMLYSELGEIIDYAYEVTNTGNVTLPEPVTVSDDQESVDCPLGDLAPNAVITCSAQRSISQDDLDAGSVTNIATAAAGTTQSDPAQVTIAVDDVADLAITMEQVSNTPGPDWIRYRVVVTNLGPQHVTGALVNSNLDAGLTNLIWSCQPGPGGSCADSGIGNVDGEPVDLDSGSEAVFQIFAELANPQAAEQIVSSATVTPPAEIEDPETDNNSATLSVQVRVFRDRFEP